MAILLVSPDSMCAGPGVVVVEAADFGLVLALVSPLTTFSDGSRHRAGRPARSYSLLARFFLRSSVRRSAFICALRKVMPVLWLVVDVLGGFGIELEGGEDEDLGFGVEGLGFSPGQFDLALLERSVLGAEGDDDALRLVLLGFGVGVEPAGAGSGSTRENSISWPPLPRMPVFSSSSRQSPWRRVSPERAMLTSAGCRRTSTSSRDRHRGRRNGLDRERTGHTASGASPSADRHRVTSSCRGSSLARGQA